MRIVEEQKSGYAVKCNCGNRFFVLKSAGVADCLECGRDDDPRRLRYKWACGNDPHHTTQCQAL